MTMIQKMHAGCSPRSSTLPDDARQSNTIFIKRDAFQSEKLYATFHDNSIKDLIKNI